MGAIQSELEVIQSEFLIGRVVDRLGLASNPEFNGTKPPGFLDSSLAPIRELWHSGIASLLAPPQPRAPQSAPQRRSAGARPTTAIPAAAPPSARSPAISASRCSAAPS